MNRKWIILLVLFFALTAIALIYLFLTPKPDEEMVQVEPTVVQPVVQSAEPTLAVDSDPDFMEKFNNPESRIEYWYTLKDGREVSIQVPQGFDPPPVAVVEELYSKVDQ